MLSSSSSSEEGNDNLCEETEDSHFGSSRSSKESYNKSDVEDVKEVRRGKNRFKVKVLTKVHDMGLELQSTSWEVAILIAIIYGAIRRDTDKGSGILSKILFLSDGSKWKKIRQSISPTLTPSKIKAMFTIFTESAKDMMDFLQERVFDSDDLKINVLAYDFTTDVLCSFAFGQRINGMKNPNSELRLMGRSIVKELNGGSFVVKIIASFFPIINRALNCKCQPIRYIEKVVTERIKHREKNGWFRNDFVQFLIQSRKRGRIVNDELLEDSCPQMATKGYFGIDKMYEQLVFHCLEMFLAGYDTMSTTIGFCLHELAINPDIQQTLIEEINEVLKEFGGEITHGAVQKMEYLDKVLSVLKCPSVLSIETLRMYPVGGTVFRTCTSSYMIPGTKTLIEKGMQMVIPVYALHHDPKYYPNPEKFDPERFNEQNKASRPRYCYLPFGEGPRMCLGMRFALLGVKVAVVALLSKYELSVSKKTLLPIRLDHSTIILSAKGDIWLRISNRNCFVISSGYEEGPSIEDNSHQRKRAHEHRVSYTYARLQHSLRIKFVHQRRRLTESLVGRETRGSSASMWSLGATDRSNEGRCFKPRISFACVRKSTAALVSSDLNCPLGTSAVRARRLVSNLLIDLGREAVYMDYNREAYCCRKFVTIEVSYGVGSMTLERNLRVTLKMGVV
uniref:Cytochrome P450 n=1 Tax=Timema genevievae TaxID=629358 RepID=A0A7R9PP28_TIMGE|nr:unnamed protein product [Timema genevievae]